MKGTISYWASLLIGGMAVLLYLLLLILTLLLTPVHSDLRLGLMLGFTLLLAASLVYLPFFRRSCRFTLTGDYIEYESGLFYHTRRRIRRSAVMVVTEMRTPFSKYGHTRTLLIAAMGGSMLLPLLREKDAAYLLAALRPSEKEADHGG